MSSSNTIENPDDSVICLDSSIDITIEDDNDEDSKSSVPEIIPFDKTLPPGVAPDGFVIIDEIQPSDNVDIPEKCEDGTKNEETTKPMFKIVFRDEAVSRLYKRRVRDFFERLVGGEVKIGSSESDSLVLEVWSKRSHRKRSHDHLTSNNIDETADTDDQEINMLFRVEKRPTLQDRLDVPTYGKKFDQIMDSTSGTAKPGEDDEKSVCRPKMNCWNCMGNHTIRDCTEPRNQMNISKNRNEFVSRSLQKVGRYHVEIDDQKYGRFVPGQISRELKRALGINDYQLPHHIYRMRKLGYPPGWLKEARLQHSGMNLYDSDGVHNSDPTKQSQGIIEGGDGDQYDAKKIQDFPGFNVRPPSGTREDDKKYWKSDRYTVNSKESLLAMINVKEVDGYKRGKLKRNPEPPIVNPQPMSTDMDVEEDVDDNIVESSPVNGFFIPPLPKSPPRNLLPSVTEEIVHSPITVNLDLEGAASPIHVDSPTLADLERRKKQLLAELDDSSEPSPPGTPVTSRSCSVTSHSLAVDQRETTVSNSEESSLTVSTMCSLTTPSRGMIKSMDLGTPILESTTPFDKLPAVENFAKDVCDIMHFENLPDSTGKYEQMTGILQKVRNTLATSQRE